MAQARQVLIRGPIMAKRKPVCIHWFFTRTVLIHHLVYNTISELGAEMSFIPMITGHTPNERDINPISDMKNPVEDVLAGMRVQRMSLVQSLRQYAFVYRGKHTMHKQKKRE